MPGLPGLCHALQLVACGSCLHLLRCEILRKRMLISQPTVPAMVPQLTCIMHHANYVQDPSREDRLAALWNATCIHAYFGDAEVAQIMLRGTRWCRAAQGMSVEATGGAGAAA